MAEQITNYRKNETGATKSEIESDAELNFQMPSPSGGLDQQRLNIILYAIYSAARVLPPELQELYRAAMYGEWGIAKAIIDDDSNAKTEKISSVGFTALHVAASCGRSEFVVELVKLLTKEELEITDQVGRIALHHVALAASVEAAKAMVEKNPRLPQLGDMDLQTPLLYAAQWRHPSKRKEMLEYLHKVTKDEPPCHAFTGNSASNLIVATTASGSYDIALCILDKYPKLAYSKNDKGMSVLHVLVMQPQAFRSGNKLSLWKTFQSKLSPQPQLQSVLGPAYQMQQEIQWYKAVEALVYYESNGEKNKEGKTPRELFIQQHAGLLKDAKDWMKDTSNSSMLVAALVATVAFAAMITVPGGNDSGTGIPLLSQKKLFIAFTVSNALSMISSVISLLLFLSIQTSRYTDEEFLVSLPSVLLYGLIFLVIAVVAMMISFGTAIGLSLKKRINWAYIPIMAVACCPAIIVYRLQLPLIFHMLLFKSGPGIFQGQRDRKFWSLNGIGYRPLVNGIP